MRLFVATLLAVLAFASPAFAVGNVAIDNTAPSAAAGARTVYKVGFSVSIALSGTDTLTVTLPGGTSTASWVGATVRDVTRADDVGYCNNPNSALIVTCGLFSGKSINANDQVLITLRGITNPVTTTPQIAKVATSKETQPVDSSAYQIVSGGQLSKPTVAIADPSAAAGAKTRYVIGFSASATGGLSADAGSQFTVVLPQGTNTSTFEGGAIRDVTKATDPGYCNNPNSSLTLTCFLFSSAVIAAGDQLQITLRGITNPSTTGARTLTVANTSDLPTVTSDPYTVSAGNALTKPTVAIADPSAAAGAKTRYVIGFSTSATGGLSADAGSEFTVVLPQGTNTASWEGGTIRDVTKSTDPGYCNNPNSSLTIKCFLFSGAVIAAGDQLQMTLRGITNPATTGARTLTVANTSDLPTVTSDPYTVSAGNALTKPTVAINAPSAAAGAKTRYVIGFSTSATGGLSADAGSEFTLVLPQGTNTASWEGGTIRDVTKATDPGYCNNPNSSLTIKCFLFSGAVIAAGDQLQVTLRGIINPATTGARTLTVANTSDLPTVTSDPYTVSAGNALTKPTVSIDAPSAAAGAKTRYVIGFSVSATGGLSADAGSELTVVLPQGTNTSTWEGAPIRDITKASEPGYCNNPNNSLTLNCFLYSGAVIDAGDQLQITLRGITNGAAGTKTLTVATTSDLPAVTSDGYDVVANHAVSGVSARIGTANPFAVVQLTTSTTGGLSGEAGSSLQIAFPAGTTFPGSQSGSIYDLNRAASVGSCGAPVGTVVTCVLFSNASVPAGSALRIALAGTVNAAAGGTVSVTTSSDTAATGTITTGDTVSPDTTVTGTAPPFQLSSEAGATFECRLDAGAWTACSSPYTPTGLAGGQHTLDVRAIDAAGNPDLTPVTRNFTVTGGPSVTITAGPVGLTNDNKPTFAFTGSGGAFECRLDGGAFAACTSPAITAFPLPDGTHTFEVRVNPTTSAARTFTVDATAPDTTVTGTALPLTFAATESARFECRLDGGSFTACSSPYAPEGLAAGQHTVEVRAIDTANNIDASPAAKTFTVSGAAVITDGPPEITDDTTPTFNFSAADAQCSLDGAPFAACTSPYTAPALASGTHTFAVRSAGNPTVARRSFSVSVPQQQTPTPTVQATSTPAPSVTPTATPTPTANQTVAQEKSGTVKIQLPGTKVFVDLDAVKGLPNGTVVDTKQGKITLTATGGKADFYDGIFKLTQKGGVTTLTLVEPLTGCGKAAKAAAGKKTKSRKLWGDGKGNFRTQGRYSAATIRGTKWLVQDTCTGTKTSVAQGVVAVRDDVKKKTIVVRAPKSYTAKPKKR